MKINSVHLQNSCCQWTPDGGGGGGGGGASRRGFLYKKSESSRGFHRRWFLLQDNLLFYFSHKRSDEPTASTPVGLIVLEGCCVERLEGLHFQLTFPGSGERKYVLAAETEEEREDWVQAMISAGYGFMQYAILEMEQAIDAFAMNQQRIAKSSSAVPEDLGQRVTTGYGPVEVRGGQVTSVVEDASLVPLGVNEKRNIEDQIPRNSRLIFERMHLQFREEIKRKTKEQHKQTYAQQ